jgi:hypothetical protein
MEGVEIRVRGQLGRDWSKRLGGLAVENTGDGDTIILGPVRDATALYGLLERLSSIGLHLMDVTERPIDGGGGPEYVKRERDTANLEMSPNSLNGGNK